MTERLLTIALSVAATWGLMQASPRHEQELVVDRLIVRRELIVSDTGQPWEKGSKRTRFPAAFMPAPCTTVPAGCGSAAG